MSGASRRRSAPTRRACSWRCSAASARGDGVRLCRFDRDRLGLVEGDTVRDVSAALDALPTSRWPLPAHDPLIAALDAVRRRVEALAPSAPARPLASVRLESPVANPGKIIGAPVNYAKHLDESRADQGIN